MSYLVLRSDASAGAALGLVGEGLCVGRGAAGEWYGARVRSDSTQRFCGGLRSLGVLAGVALLLACAAPRPLRAPRIGPQRDARGRVFYELRRITALGCTDGVASTGGSLGAMTGRLTANAQAQGYSGVVDVVCAPQTLNGCASGVLCSALAVRYVVPSSGGAAREPRAGPCVPPCEASASCQEGQCVAGCDPVCGAGEVCGPEGRCDPAVWLDEGGERAAAAR